MSLSDSSGRVEEEENGEKEEDLMDPWPALLPRDDTSMEIHIYTYQIYRGKFR